MEQMRERAREILNAHCEYMGGMDRGQAFIRTENALKAVEAALSLMQPEIDRRVAEERAKLLERLREPSEAMIEAGGIRLDELQYELMSDNERSVGVWQAMLTAFQQENSDA